MHYHVLVSLKGCYMPDCNDIYETHADAVIGAKWHADAWNEGASDEDQMEQVYADMWESRHNCITVHECSDMDCESEIEQRIESAYAEDEVNAHA